MASESTVGDPAPREQRPVRSATLTMADVARVAGVSAQTVSRALNNTGRISDDTRERVLKVVDELGYHRNAAARTLVNRRSGLVGIVVSDTDQYAPRLTMFGIESSLGAKGFGVSLASYDHGKLEQARAAVWQLAAQGVEAIVLIGAAPVPLSPDERAKLAIPIVSIRGDLTDDPHAVGIDQAAGGRLATQHLLRQGHGSVTHIGGPEGWLDSQLREDGWRAALEAARQPIPPVQWRGDWTARSGYKIGHAIGEAGQVSDIGALFVANDQMAMGVCRALIELGLSIPGDVSIVGFDDLPEAAYYTPPLTTVRQDLATLGSRAAALVVSLITDDMPGETAGLLAPTLVVEGRLSGD